MNKFKAEVWWKPEINEVEIARETESCVFLANGRRVAKITERGQFFDSYDEAKTWLMERAATEIESARRKLERAHAMFGNIKGMRQAVNQSQQEGE